MRSLSGGPSAGFPAALSPEAHAATKRLAREILAEVKA
jgi:hypothetical protein